MKQSIYYYRLIFAVFCSFTLVLTGPLSLAKAQTPTSDSATNNAFEQASKEFQIPIQVLKAICYMEGHLSTHKGYPSVDNGYGCMHLVKNKRANNLDKAASLLNVSTDQLQHDMTTNIRGGAVLLREEALQLSPDHTLPASLPEWYGVIASYSKSTTEQTAKMYADEAFDVMKKGYNAPADSGEIITLPPQNVTPDKQTADNVKATTPLPQGCMNDGKTDFPGALDCPLDPAKYNCNAVASTSACTYEDANRPIDLPIIFVGIHDIEGTVQDGLNIFQDPNSSVSIHYIVDTDGTVYQMVREKDIAYHIGNFWYNQRSIGIEHAGFDATGFQWYNAAEYLGSAKLTAYLLKKYNIPLDHNHLVSHGTVPAPTLGTSPNHVDPGPYWLWDYYLKLIHEQGIAYAHSKQSNHIISLHPKTDKKPFNPNGTETPANFNFFYLYNGPSTKSGLIPSAASGTDIMDETNNVEPALSYYYLDKMKDPAGSGNTLYQIWYGENDQVKAASVSAGGAINGESERIKEGSENDRPKGGASSNNASSTDPSGWFAHAKLAWLAVPPGAEDDGMGILVKLTASDSANLKIYGRPVSDEKFVIGDAPNNAIFVSAFSQTEAGTNRAWYEINYNHRQAWIPSFETKPFKK